MGPKTVCKQLREFRTAADPPNRARQVAEHAVILQADEQEFLLVIGTFCFVKELCQQLPNIFIILVVIAEIVLELSGKNSAEYR